MDEIPLGKPVEFPEEYAPDVLCAIPRAESRSALGLQSDLPFQGKDIWNAWELTWLATSGTPVVGTATICIDAASPNLIESKSLKLYLNSLAMTRFANRDELATIINRDLSRTAGLLVDVSITPASDSTSDTIGEFPGKCIDTMEIGDVPTDVDAAILATDTGDSVTETLYSHLLRSNCPVTNQPDSGSVLIRYRGQQIDRRALLTYLVSFRRHNDFHEACVERIFVDIKKYCEPTELTVYARYNRRGGLDINPFRSDFEDSAENLRLWRQ
jgi:7-cyano-7-deazaguanine reductase